MFNLPFLHKNAAETERYIFILFLSGEKLYGFAFEEANSQNQSAIYQEAVDPFLKESAKKVEKIIANCERDLGENVYLKRTVLVLNSIYTTESGAIREDFLKEIKKLLKTVDLDNLGYLNFYEAILHNFEKEAAYLFLEERLYDYSLYEIEKAVIKNIHKTAKAQEFGETIKDLNKQLDDKSEIIAWLGNAEEKPDLKIKHLIKESDLQKLLIKVYFKDKQSVAVEPEKEELKSGVLPLAPGFGTELSSVPSQSFTQPKKISFKLPSFNLKIKFPKVSRQVLWLGIPILILSLGLLYFIFFHQAVITLQTKKENFSSNIEFTVNSKSEFVKAYETRVSLTVSEPTTGEKVTGEKAKGEVTIYNGLFETKELSEGARFISADGVVFVINAAVSVPAATTSANLGEGLVTKAFGKKNIELTALNIGAEANLDSGAKLTTEDFSDDEFYAIANNNFSGGFKKTVAVFDNVDAVNLDKKALVMSKNKLQNEFKKTRGDNDVLFAQTISTTGVKKDYSAEINEEVNRVTLSYEGQVKAFYAPYVRLAEMVERQKLKDKEFVQDSFELSKIKLISQKNGNYLYSAIGRGQVQNFIDRNILIDKLKGKLKGQAQKILDEERNITSFQIQTKPLPLPYLPLMPKAIKFEFTK